MPDEQPKGPEGGRRVRFVSAWPAPDDSDGTTEPKDATDRTEPDVQPGPAAPGDGADGSVAFPGGRVRLPRIEEARRRRLSQGGESSVRFVGTAFVRPPREADVEERAQNPTGFSEYYTYESLFEAPAVEEEVEPVTADERALAALGLAPDATWTEVVAAHRQLVKETHPDLLVGADPVTIEAATDRLRTINLAYAQLKKARRSNS